MNKMQRIESSVKPLLLCITLLGLTPAIAGAECLQGPNVVVNEGHGASITFDEPVYQAKLFDVSRLILNEIPETGSETLILTAVNPVEFPGLPSGPQTSLLATTATDCYVFQLSVGQGTSHMSVDAEDGNLSARSLLAADSDLEDFEPLNLENLRAGVATAAQRVGADNAFVIRVNEFLALVDKGVGQRVAAQRLQINWEHLTALADRSRLDDFYEGSVSQ
jgi:hypothetical protein